MLKGFEAELIEKAKAGELPRPEKKVHPEDGQDGGYGGRGGGGYGGDDFGTGFGGSNRRGGEQGGGEYSAGVLSLHSNLTRCSDRGLTRVLTRLLAHQRTRKRLCARALAFCACLHICALSLQRSAPRRKFGAG